MAKIDVSQYNSVSACENGTRSDWGNRWWERIWSVLATCEQQGKAEKIKAYLRVFRSATRMQE